MALCFRKLFLKIKRETKSEMENHGNKLLNQTLDNLVFFSYDYIVSIVSLSIVKEGFGCINTY
ncbi:MAG: hypothetical protein A2066_20885 [Bacteroidetes bacterium GWB2_41_8]|nr:MAG: hypothetical protein A2066_20885 [Bacteroidetes bacterium GWB2_41_8]